MKELPKELTPELLGLILGKEVVKYTVREENIIYHTKNVTYKDNPSVQKPINIDTLTRLILEAIEAKGCIYNLFNSTSVKGYVMIIDDRKYTAGSIFEVALKHFARIAKEKGLLDG